MQVLMHTAMWFGLNWAWACTHYIVRMYLEMRLLATRIISC